MALLWGVLVVVTAPAQVLLPARVDLVPAAPSSAQPIPAALTAPKSPRPKKRMRVLALSSDDWLSYLEAPSALEDDGADEPGGALRDGGILRLSADLDIKLGLGEGEISWDGSGGFAAYGSERRVRIRTTDGKPLRWGSTPHFLGEDDVLIFGARDADATLVWDSALNLGSSREPRTIRVVKSEADFSGATVRFDSSFSGGNLLFTGDGRVDINAANVEPNYTVVVHGAELRLSGSGSFKNSWVYARNGARIVLDNSGTHNPNRLLDGGYVQLDSGSLAYWGALGRKSRERVGTVSLAGANTIDVVNNTATANTRLVLAGIYHFPTATVNFTNSRSANGEFGAGATKTPQIKITNTGQPNSRVTVTGDILPYATVNGRDFATLRGAFIVAYGGYHTGDPSAWNKNVNASPTGDHALVKYTEINSLRLTGQRLTIHDSGLRLGANALLATGTKESRIDGGPLYASGNATNDASGFSDNSFYVHVYGSGGLTISASIRLHPTKTRDGIRLVKTGDGTLRLSGDQSNDLASWGGSKVQQGTLILAKTGGAIALGGIVDVLERSILRLEGSQQLAADTTLILRGRPQSIRGTNDVAGSSTLQFGKAAGAGAGISQTVADFDVVGHGIIDFDSGSGPDSPNFLYIEKKLLLVESHKADQLLLVRGWHQYSDRILIRRTADLSRADLSKIKFEGYEGAHLVDYNADYLEITPFVPEPAVCGALLGTLSLGFFAWRKRLKAGK